MAQHKNTPAEPSEILPSDEYDAIEAAVMETARGRWFLTEYAQRRRVADTGMLLDAIAKLEKSLGEKSGQAVAAPAAAPMAPQGSPESTGKAVLHKIRLAVSDLSAAIQLTRQEIEELGATQIANGGFEPERPDLNDIFSDTERATSDILTAAEAIQAFASLLRDQGTDPEMCDVLDQHAIEIYTACTIQDLTGKRISKLIALTGFVEEEVQSILKVWETGEAEAELEKPPVSEAGGLDDADADTRPADVFENTVVAPADAESGNNTEEINIEKSGPQTSEFDDAANSHSSAAEEPFAGQDTFESTAEILKQTTKS